MRGFTTGRWEGNTLVTTTTHMKASMIRRNGAPVSDQATMTMYVFRHGDLLTIRAVMDDPVYLSEPLVRSRVWALDPDGNLNLGNGVASPCEPIAELPVTDTAGVVPHYLPGQNPFVKELTERHNIPVEAVLGGAETMYPEYRKKLTGYVPPADLQAVLRVRRARCALHRGRQRGPEVRFRDVQSAMWWRGFSLNRWVCSVQS